MNHTKQYLTYATELFTAEETENISAFLRKYNLEGTEIHMNEAHPRTENLFQSREEKEKWRAEFSALGVKRIHCSYWGYPTSFLTKSHFKELSERMGGPREMMEYYGDLKGVHLYERWSQEYELACALGAQAYVFHMIDYAVIDGAWEFTISREEILQAMVGMLQTFLTYLEEKKLLTEHSPVIELENAGWGLEYGAQRSEDFAFLFEQIYDPLQKVKIGWDINHLLHAIGRDERGNGARFMLQDFEITPKMAGLEQAYRAEPEKFAMKWIESNLLDPSVSGKVNCLHLSDCKLKEVEYFRNGRLQAGFGEKIDSLPTREKKSDYGVGIVLDQYDSHVPMGTGVLLPKEMRSLIGELKKQNDPFVLLHELKNSRALASDLETQLDFLKE